MQPGGHRFEPGILHQHGFLESRLHGAERDRKIEKVSALLQLNILQTVVFSDHKYTHAVCKELSRAGMRGAERGVRKSNLLASRTTHPVQR